VRDVIQTQAIRLLGDHDDHPSLRRLLADGFQIITF
jgi:hypothetical protein